MGTSSIVTNGLDLNSMIPGGLESLVNAMQDFTSAEILMALMMMAAAGGKDDDEESGGGSAAMGFLAGLALAGGLGQSLNIQLDISITGIEGGGLGGQMDMTA